MKYAQKENIETKSLHQRKLISGKRVEAVLFLSFRDLDVQAFPEV